MRGFVTARYLPFIDLDLPLRYQLRMLPSLHTAIQADLSCAVVQAGALLASPQIFLHGTGNSLKLTTSSSSLTLGHKALCRGSRSCGTSTPEQLHAVGTNI